VGSFGRLGKILRAWGELLNRRKPAFFMANSRAAQTRSHANLIVDPLRRALLCAWIGGRNVKKLAQKILP
jgi:hypothetical protein